MISSFLPITTCHSKHAELYMPPATASFMDEKFGAYGLPNGSFQSLRLKVCEKPAPGKHCAESQRPVVLFSGALSTSRHLYNAMLQNIAAAGYMTISIDHPFDADFVEFPDGSIVKGVEIDSDAQIQQAVTTRVADIAFVYKQLHNISALGSFLPGYLFPQAMPEVVVVGHSLGGAAAASALGKIQSLRGGANLDGTMFGPVLKTGFEQPFMLMGHENKTQETDSSWKAIWPRLTGWKKEFEVKSMTHYSFSDLPLVITTLGLDGKLPSEAQKLLGSNEGIRGTNLTTTYVKAFLEMVSGDSNREAFADAGRDFSERTLDCTGATGYIGGDTLFALCNKHSDYEIAALVRTEEKAKSVTQAFPNVRIVLAELDDAKVLEEEAGKADVVIHTADASDNEVAAKAIAKGLASGHSKEKPGYWLHTGGAGILCWETMRDDNKLGEWSDREYNDWTAVQDLTGLPQDAFHKNVDDLVLASGSDSVKTAILCPPTIYGRGRGPLNTRSRQAYELAHLILTAGYIPIIGQGKARWNNVHVSDLAQLFVLLTEAAIANNTDPQLWNEQGYYLVENGEHLWADLARLMGKKAIELGLVKSQKMEESQLGKDKAIEQAGFEAVSWGFNSRGKSVRARKLVGWEPEGPSIEGNVPEILRDEKSRLDKN
ncbi:nad(P)-binding protein [Stemphylium lycopersici]|uniref:Nad(P)-binding protein n=1 Tax=Stemphylium lycopersici TaxID=183478 RepID=A0A364MU74_STELY|nr:nad(P)-binding protein [Stemphylium lycopersici]